MEGIRKVAEVTSRHAFEEKIREGFKKGNKFGHSITKPRPNTCLAEVPDGNGGTTTAVNKVIDHYTKEWGHWWQAKPGGAEVSQEIWPDDTKVPKMQAAAIRKASASFKNRKSCPCGLHPRHLAMLSDELLEAVARQWTFWERYGQVPRQERQLTIALTDKPDGGLRPIALFRAAYRMMARVNVARLQDWAAQLDCCAINSVAGRQVSDAVWRIMADRDIQEAEEEEGTEDVFFCEMQQDVTKAYEHVDRELLAIKAVQERMPVSVIRLSLASYAWTRRLVYNGVFSEPLDTTRGIGAGAAPATFELVCYVIKDIREMMELGKDWKGISIYRFMWTTSRLRLREGPSILL